MKFRTRTALDLVGAVDAVLVAVAAQAVEYAGAVQADEVIVEAYSAQKNQFHII